MCNGHTSVCLNFKGMVGDMDAQLDGTDAWQPIPAKSEITHPAARRRALKHQPNFI